MVVIRLKRYRIQAKAAAIEALKILDDELIDKVYCDFHDDYVVRYKQENNVHYLFYQVKTNNKKNAQWKISDLLGLNTNRHNYNSTDCEKVKNSFVGKSLYHTILFKGTCNKIIFQTNIHTNDAADNLIIEANNNNFTDKYLKFLVNHFNEIFEREITTDLTESEIKENIKKLKFETDVEHLKSKTNFPMITGEKIFEYSEIDLTRKECSEIFRKLIELVENKSEGIIKELTPKNIDSLTCISIKDLLSVLSLSEAAYFELKKSNDSHIIKSISKIQRLFKGQNINEEVIEFCSRAKVKWDN